MGKQGGLDRYRLIAAFLVIAIHTSPLLSVNENADFFLTRIFARMAVPLFLMITDVMWQQNSGKMIRMRKVVPQQCYSGF